MAQSKSATIVEDAPAASVGERRPLGIAWRLLTQGAKLVQHVALRLFALARFCVLFAFGVSVRVLSFYRRRRADVATAPVVGARRPCQRYLVAVVALVAAGIFFVQAQLVGRIDLFYASADALAGEVPAASPSPVPPVALPALDDPGELVRPPARRAVAIAAPSPAAWPFARAAFSYFPAVRPNATFFLYLPERGNSGGDLTRADAQGAYAIHSRLVELGYSSAMAGWSVEGHAGWPPYASVPLERAWEAARAALRPGDFVLAPLAYVVQPTPPFSTALFNTSSVGSLGSGVRGAVLLASPASADALASIPRPFTAIPMSWGLASAAQSLAWSPLMRPLLSSVYGAAGYDPECFDANAQSPPAPTGPVVSTALPANASALAGRSPAQCIAQARARHESRLGAKRSRTVLMLGTAAPGLGVVLAEKGASVIAVPGDGSGVPRATMSRASVLIDVQSTTPASLAAVASLFDVLPLADPRSASGQVPARTDVAQVAPVNATEAMPVALAPRDYGFASASEWVNATHVAGLRSRVEAALGRYRELAAALPLRAEALQWRRDFTGLVHMFASSAALLFRTRVPLGSELAAYRLLLSIVTHFPLAAVEVVTEDEAAWHATMRGRWQLLGPSSNFVHVVAAASASPSLSATRTSTPTQSSTRTPSKPGALPTPGPSTASVVPVEKATTAAAAAAAAAATGAGPSVGRLSKEKSHKKSTRSVAPASLPNSATSTRPVLSVDPAANATRTGRLQSPSAAAAESSGATADVSPPGTSPSAAGVASPDPLTNDPVSDVSDEPQQRAPPAARGRRLLADALSPPASAPARKTGRGVPLAKVSLSRSWQQAAFAKTAEAGAPADAADPPAGAPGPTAARASVRGRAAPPRPALKPPAAPRLGKKPIGRASAAPAALTNVLSRDLCAGARLVIELSPDALLLSHELVNAAAAAVAGLPEGPLSSDQVARSGEALLRRPSLWLGPAASAPLPGVTSGGREAPRGGESAFMATYPATHARCVAPLARLAEAPARLPGGPVSFGGADALRLLRGSLVSSPPWLWEREPEGGAGAATPADVAAVLRSSARAALRGVAALEDDGGGDGGAGRAAVGLVLEAVDAWERHVTYPEPHWAVLRAWRGAFDNVAAAALQAA